ncbi:D-amino-acid transaminase [Leucothrix mucor]|uniref:D-amino-acid transaminase n=1 Tax=Leucothrix mucor TaxID=45248 RepID=UPI0003B7AB3C|nr:D-amino-acid transaminase [Leucothrix mucor]
MSRIVYVNGEFVPEADAKVSVFDRGFMFADGVYEVSSVLRGKLIENNGHMVRLRRSLSELEMPSPATDEEIEAIQKELIKRNNLDEGLVYLQVTRGAADRDFAYPKGVAPTLVMFTQAKNVLGNPISETGISVITVEDIRWGRRDIKTVGLLAPCMAKMQAKAAGADDAWMVEDGYITEGSSNNAYIVTDNGTIVTRQIGHEILNGITRRAVLALAEKHSYKVEERLFTVEECYNAAEAFVTSATLFVQPVVKIDDKQIGDGRPGLVAQQLRELYIGMALAEVESA